jgi:CheY-like chemotaxis protein
VFEFTVSDTGIGIPKDKLSSIFESFTQASSETTRKYGGPGLGLAIAKKLLELQNGSISLKSHLNVGTTFTFTIPYQKTSHENTNRTKEKWLPVNKIQNLNILLAEDNLLNQKLVIKLLEDANCSVDVAENGLQAIDKVKQNSYDLILMDIQMPQMDGLEASKIIRDQLQVNIPIIALTAHTMEHEKDKCIKAGMNGFLSKPFNFESLHKTIFEFTSIDTSLKSTNKINLSLLTNLADGNFDFIIKMLEIYLKQTPENLASLNQGIRTKQYSEIASVAHKMRSSVPYVGLTEAEKLLESIEYEAREKIELKKLPAKIKVLCDICNESLHAVQQELERIKKSYISK